MDTPSSTPRPSSSAPRPSQWNRDGLLAAMARGRSRLARARGRGLVPVPPMTAPEPTRPGLSEEAKDQLARPTMTTTGRTSSPPALAPAHRCELVERHEIGASLPGIRNPIIEHYDELLDECRQRALDWAEAHGLELIDLARTSRTSGHGQGAWVGVTFTVVVGKGELSADQRLPGVLDNWRWSARFQHWRRVFTNADGRKGALLARAEDGQASVTRIHPARSGAMSMDGVLRDGCSCHIGGPFVDICPVHFQADR